MRFPVPKEPKPPPVMSKPLIAGVCVLLACVNVTIEEKTRQQAAESIAELPSEYTEL